MTKFFQGCLNRKISEGLETIAHHGVQATASRKSTMLFTSRKLSGIAWRYDALRLIFNNFALFLGFMESCVAWNNVRRTCDMMQI